MFENCKTYNRDDCKLYRDCVHLQKVMHNRLEELNVDAGIVPPTHATSTAATIFATPAAGNPDLFEEIKKQLDTLRLCI